MRTPAQSIGASNATPLPGPFESSAAMPVAQGAGWRAGVDVVARKSAAQRLDHRLDERIDADARRQRRNVPARRVQQHPHEAF